MNRGKKQEEKREQPIFVDFYNLDLNNENAIDTFIFEVGQKAAPLLLYGEEEVDLGDEEINAEISKAKIKERQKAIQQLREEQPFFKRVCDRIISGETLDDREIDEVNRRIFRFHPYLMRKEDDDWTEELMQGSLIIQPSQNAESDYILFYRWFPEENFTFSTIILYAYLALVNHLITRTTIKRCQAPKTQKTPACQNIFIPQAKGKEQKYCSKKCANRVRRRKYYQKHKK